MHPKIAEFISTNFYNNELTNGVTIQERTNLLIKKRQEDGLELMQLQMKYNSIKEKNEHLRESNNEEIDELMKGTTYVDNPDISIEDLVNSNDVDVDNITLDELIK